MAKLLVETSSQVETLTENNGDGKTMFIEGIFAQAELKNGNGRIYPKAIMEKAVENYMKDFVTKRRALGELNHPDRPFADPSKGAILIESLHWEGNNVIGKARVLGTHAGKDVQALIEGGFAMGVSTRALGTVIENSGMKVVQDDLMLTAVDCVDNPSAPDAYVNPLMESINWINENGIWMPEVPKTPFDEQLFLEKLEQLLKGRT